MGEESITEEGAVKKYFNPKHLVNERFETTYVLYI